MEQKLIRETLTTEYVHVTDEDRELGDAFNKIAWEALGWAKWFLRHGPEHARVTVVKQFLSSSAKLAAVDASAELETHRMTFQRELALMADVIPAEIEITPTGPINPDSHAPLPDPVYQRTEHSDHEP